jgi:quercetin dioxygenase-like cupin family protein
MQVLAGETEITIAGQPHQLQTGDAIIMPAHDPHAVKALTQFKMLLTMIRS